MGKLINLAGRQFGLWTVEHRAPNNQNGKTQWVCRCDCGVVKTVTTNSLLTYNSTSCGCNCMVDLAGKTFGDLVVLTADYSTGRRAWLCCCSCGKMIVVSSGDLRSKRIISCSEQNSCAKK